MERKRRELATWQQLLRGAKTKEGAELATRAIKRLTAEIKELEEGGEL